MERCINKIMIESEYIKDTLKEKLKVALEVVEGYEEGKKKEVLKKFFSRAYRHASQEEELEKIEAEKRSMLARGEKEYSDRQWGKEAEGYYKEQIKQIKKAKKEKNAQSLKKIKRNRGKGIYQPTNVFLDKTLETDLTG